MTEKSTAPLTITVLLKHDRETPLRILKALYYLFKDYDCDMTKLVVENSKKYEKNVGD